jgi:hypothetical protein
LARGSSPDHSGSEEVGRRPNNRITLTKPSRRLRRRLLGYDPAVRAHFHRCTQAGLPALRDSNCTVSDVGLVPAARSPYGTAIQSKYFGTITVVLGDARFTSSTNDCSRAIAGAWLISYGTLKRSQCVGST